MKRRIAVTGLGLVTPSGKGWQAYWKAALEGRSSIRAIQSMELNGFIPKLAGEVLDFRPQDYITQRKSIKLMSRDIQIAVAASCLALSDSHLDMTMIDRDSFGVCIGAGIINSELDELGMGIRGGIAPDGRFDMAKFGTDGIKALFPLWFLKYLPNMPACHISITHGLRGPNNTITTSSAAALQAIGEASRIIERGDADRMLAGGTDSKINALGLSRLSMLGFLSGKNGGADCYTPFDVSHDGLIPAEGSGIVVLEEYNLARQRGAQIYGEIAGFGTSAQNQPLGTEHGFSRFAKERAINHALRDAGLSAGDIDAVVADGCGIPQQDIEEAEALQSVFGKSLARVAITSLKPVTGHTIYASGGIEIAAALQMMREDTVPPLLNLRSPASRCSLPFVTGKAVKRSVRHILLNSFGLGGQNASIVLKKSAERPAASHV